jgi:hypothetical protein
VLADKICVEIFMQGMDWSFATRSVDEDLSDEAM